MSLTPGTSLGPYEIVGPLGAGGMGEVYKAKDTRLDRTVAIKVLPDSFAGGGGVGTLTLVQILGADLPFAEPVE